MICNEFLGAISELRNLKNLDNKLYQTICIFCESFQRISISQQGKQEDLPSFQLDARRSSMNNGDASK